MGVSYLGAINQPVRVSISRHLGAYISEQAFSEGESSLSSMNIIQRYKV